MAAATFQFGAAQPKTTGSVAFGGKSTGFSFGSGLTSSTATTGLAGSTFGAVATQSGRVSALGTTTLPSTSSTGFNFGATSSGTPSAGFTLGGLSTPKTAASTPLQTGLGITAASTARGFSFGKSTTGTAATQGTTGFSLLGGQKTTGAFTLGAIAPTTATSGSGFTLGGKTSAATLPTLGALSQATATTTPLFVGTTTATTATAAIGLGSLTSSGRVIGGTTLTSTATGSTGLSVTGLGGQGTSSTLTGAISRSNSVNQQETNLKDIVVPGPLVEIVENIKKYVKAQKEHRDEISRFSVSSMEKVREETVSLRQTLALVSNSIQRDGCAVENLKMDVAQELKNAEIAQRTNDIPAALQHENTAPQEYFQSLVESFEERMQVYRKQIEIMESHLASLSQSQTLTPQDLSEVMHKIHKTFISLAAILHAVHEAVKVQKEHYLNYRKAYFKDTADVFAANYNHNAIALRSTSELGLGPSPFYLRNGTTTNVALNSTNFRGSQGLGLGLASGALGSINQGIQTGGTFGALGASATPSVGFGGQSSVAGFGSSLGTPGVLGGGLGSTSLNLTQGTGFGAASSAGFGFGTPQASTAFGSLAGGTTPAVAATGTPMKSFQLQRPPAGNKRGKKR